MRTHLEEGGRILAPRSPDITPTSDESRRCLAFLQDILKDVHPREFAIRCWDGRTWDEEGGQVRRFTLVIKRPGAMRALLLAPSQLAVGEAFLNDDVDVEGDLEAATTLGRYFADYRWNLRDRLRVCGWLWRLPRPAPDAGKGRTPVALVGGSHSKGRDRQAVSYHYDASNDFYRLWLDSRMVYSCAYFLTSEEDLETAQLRKLDYTCRKLRLRPGERLLDIGCGWGGLIMRAAEQYGVEAVGITLSAQQAAWATRAIQEKGLADRCRVEIRDYRDLPADWIFDKVVSIGMVEHVGRTRLPDYFRAAWSALRRGGIFLTHGIACREGDVGQVGPFMERYVFPDSELVPLHVTVRQAEAMGFHVRDVECLREHYTLTLRQWVHRLEAAHSQVVALVGERTYRVWRLYMAACAQGFRVGWYDVYQTILSKPDDGQTGLPLTRADLMMPT